MRRSGVICLDSSSRSGLDRSRMVELDVFLFFFSSRRRHTRLQGDWSSDVCSSDLTREGSTVDGSQFRSWGSGDWGNEPWSGRWENGGNEGDSGQYVILSAQYGTAQIGRASCRERV